MPLHRRLHREDNDRARRLLDEEEQRQQLQPRHPGQRDEQAPMSPEELTEDLQPGERDEQRPELTPRHPGERDEERPMAQQEPDYGVDTTDVGIDIPEPGESITEQIRRMAEVEGLHPADSQTMRPSRREDRIEREDPGAPAFEAYEALGPDYPDDHFSPEMREEALPEYRSEFVDRFVPQQLAVRRMEEGSAPPSYYDPEDMAEKQMLMQEPADPEMGTMEWTFRRIYDVLFEGPGFATAEGLFRMMRSSARFAADPERYVGNLIKDAGSLLFNEEYFEDIDIGGQPAKAPKWLDHMVDFYSKPEIHGLSISQTSQEYMRRREQAYDKSFTRGLAEDIAYQGTEVMGMLIQMGAVNALGRAFSARGLSAPQGVMQPQVAAQEPGFRGAAKTLFNRMKDGIRYTGEMHPQQYADIMGRVQRIGAHGLMTTPGDLEARIEGAIYRMGYNITPVIANATGATGMTAKSADVALNSMLTYPMYRETWEEEGGFTPDFISFAVQQLAQDVIMARGTRGFLNIDRGAQYNKYVDRMAKISNMDREDVHHCIKRGRQIMTDMERAEGRDLWLEGNRTVGFGSEHGARNTGHFGTGIPFTDRDSAMDPGVKTEINRADYAREEPRHTLRKGDLELDKLSKEVRDRIERLPDDTMLAPRDLLTRDDLQKVNQVNDIMRKHGVDVDTAMRRAEVPEGAREAVRAEAERRTADPFLVGLRDDPEMLHRHYSLYEPRDHETARALHDFLGRVNNLTYGNYGARESTELFRGLVQEADRFFPGVEREDVAERLRGLYRYSQEIMQFTPNERLEYDTPSTVLMRSLGYDGIDARGLKGPDGQKFTSVIHDFKVEPHRMSKREFDRQEWQMYRERKAGLHEMPGPSGMIAPYREKTHADFVREALERGEEVPYHALREHRDILDGMRPWQMSLDVFDKELTRYEELTKAGEQRVHREHGQPPAELRKKLGDRDEDWVEWARERGYNEKEIQEFARLMELSGRGYDYDYRQFTPENMWRQHVERAIDQGERVPEHVRQQYQWVASEFSPATREDYRDWREESVNTTQERYEDLVERRVSEFARYLQREQGLPPGLGQARDGIRVVRRSGDPGLSHQRGIARAFGVNSAFVELHPHWGGVNAVMVDTGRGVYTPEIGSRSPMTFINVRGDVGPGKPTKIAMHEVGHNMINMLPQRGEHIINMMRNSVIDDDRIKRVVNSRKAEEVVCNYLGELATTKHFWDGMKSVMPHDQWARLSAEATRYRLGDTRDRFSKEDRQALDRQMIKTMRDYHAMANFREVFEGQIRPVYERLQHRLTPGEAREIRSSLISQYRNADEYFYKSEEVIKGLGETWGDKHGSVRAQEAINYLQSKKAGIKKAELEQLGLIDWLSEKNPREKVHRDELLEYINNNKLTVMETQLGGRIEVPDDVREAMERHNQHIETYRDYFNNYAQPVYFFIELATGRRLSDNLMAITKNFRDHYSLARTGQRLVDYVHSQHGRGLAQETGFTLRDLTVKVPDIERAIENPDSLTGLRHTALPPDKAGRLTRDKAEAIQRLLNDYPIFREDFEEGFRQVLKDMGSEFEKAAQIRTADINDWARTNNAPPGVLGGLGEKVKPPLTPQEKEEINIYNMYVNEAKTQYSRVGQLFETLHEAGVFGDIPPTTHMGVAAKVNRYTREAFNEAERMDADKVNHAYHKVSEQIFDKYNIPPDRVMQNFFAGEGRLQDIADRMAFVDPSLGRLDAAQRLADNPREFIRRQILSGINELADADRVHRNNIIPLIRRGMVELTDLGAPVEYKDHYYRDPPFGRFRQEGGIEDSYGMFVLRLPEGESRYQYTPPSGHQLPHNTVMHIRHQDFYDEQGNRILFIEEVQSDWANAMRQYQQARGLTEEERGRYNELVDKLGESPKLHAVHSESGRAETFTLEPQAREKVDNLPLLKHGNELAAKKIIQYAAEKGYDGVAISSGEQQAQRWGIGQHVDQVSTYIPDTLRSPVARQEGREHLTDQERAELEGYVRKMTVPYIGEEATKRLFEQTPEKVSRAAMGGKIDVFTERYLEGEELRINDQFYYTLYDNMLPKAFEKELKKHGVKGQSIRLENMHYPRVGKPEYQVRFGQENPIDTMRKLREYQEDIARRRPEMGDPEFEARSRAGSILYTEASRYGYGVDEKIGEDVLKSAVRRVERSGIPEPLVTTGFDEIVGRDGRVEYVEPGRQTGSWGFYAKPGMEAPYVLFDRPHSHMPEGRFSDRLRELSDRQLSDYRDSIDRALRDYEGRIDQRKEQDWKNARDLIDREMDRRQATPAEAAPDRYTSSLRRMGDDELDSLRRNYEERLRQAHKPEWQDKLDKVSEEIGRRQQVDEAAQVTRDRDGNLLFPRLDKRENEYINRLDRAMREYRNRHRDQLQDFLREPDKIGRLAEFFRDPPEDLPVSRGLLPALEKIQQIQAEGRAPMPELNFKELKEVYNASLAYMHRQVEQDRLVLGNEVRGLQETGDKIVRDAQRAHARKTSKRDIEELMRNEGVSRERAEQIAAEKQVLPGQTQSGWFRKWAGIKNYTTERIAKALQGKKYDAKDILHDRPMPEIFKYTYWAAQKSYERKYELQRDIFTRMQDLMTRHNEQGYHPMKDGDSLAKKWKDVNSKIFDLEGGRIDHQGNIDIKRIELSKAEAMDIYMMAKNDDVRAMLLNPEGGLRTEGHKSNWAKKTKHDHTRKYVITENDLQKITDWLKPHEKERADFMFDMYNRKLKDFVNRETLNSLGYPAALIENYVPIRRAKAERPEDKAPARAFNRWANLPAIAPEQLGTRTYEAMGLLQERTMKEGPVLAEDAYRKFSSYVSAASDLPFIQTYKNFNKIFRNKGFQQQIDRYGMKDAREQLEENMRFIASLQNKELSDLEKTTGDLFQRFQQAKLGLSPWIPPIQGISLLYAYSQIPTRYMQNEIKGLVSKETFEEMRRWAPVSGWGRLAQGAMSRSAGEIHEIGRTKQHITGETHGTWSTWAIRQVDAQVVGRIWEDVKRWVADERPDLQGDAYMRKVADIYEHIVNTTQPTHLPHTRGAITLSRDPFLRGLTMFFSQRNKIWNELAHTVTDYRNSERTTEDKADALKKMFLFGIAGSLLLTRRDEWRDMTKMRPSRDDWLGRLERWFRYTAGTNPVLGQPLELAFGIAREGEWSRFYDLSNPIYEMFNQGIRGLALGVEGMVQLINSEEYKSGPWEGEEKWARTLARGVHRMLDAGDTLTGFPFRNAVTLLQDAGRWVSPETQFMVDHVIRQPDPTGMYEDYWEFLEGGQKQMAHRTMYIMMTELERDLGAFRQSFQTYYDRDMLSEEHWKEAEKMFKDIQKDLWRYGP